MTVHLSRKWRSKNFNELIGQELSVRLLKNSLFKKSFFPAYLFSGLRGSGKTSMGRIFAAAVNCGQLASFIALPQEVIIPCGSCISCAAMAAGQHPDFIEIDAASHTGVDNIRLIIENASLLPVLGNKKIYLIDEAHMLSKAAFNAALKILEEPPLHSMFILATTDPEKIIETIKSRCFQVFFDPILPNVLCPHLKKICEAEHITYDMVGLSMLAEQSGGSVRDALTTLERIMLSEGEITATSVSRALGLVEKSVIQALYDILISGDIKQLALFLSDHTQLLSNPLVVWKVISDAFGGQLYQAEVIAHVDKYQQILQALRICYETEILLHKTSAARSVVEYMLFRIAHGAVIYKARNSTTIVPISAPTITKLQHITQPEVIKEPEQTTPWHIFLEHIKPAVEPLVYTLLSAAQIDYQPGQEKCRVRFLKEHELFKEWLERSAVIWKPLMHKLINASVEFDIEFTLHKEPNHGRERSNPVLPIRYKKDESSLQAHKQSEHISKVLTMFPGTVQELK